MSKTKIKNNGLHFSIKIFSFLYMQLYNIKNHLSCRMYALSFSWFTLTISTNLSFCIHNPVRDLRCSVGKNSWRLLSVNYFRKALLLEVSQGPGYTFWIPISLHYRDRKGVNGHKNFLRTWKLIKTQKQISKKRCVKKYRWCDEACKFSALQSVFI